MDDVTPQAQQFTRPMLEELFVIADAMVGWLPALTPPDPRLRISERRLVPRRFQLQPSHLSSEKPVSKCAFQFVTCAATPRRRSSRAPTSPRCSQARERREQSGGGGVAGVTLVQIFHIAVFLVQTTASKPHANKQRSAVFCFASLGSLLAGYLMSTLFYEPSTRTRLSFEVGICTLESS
jgi:hypothetical protein